MRCLIANRGDIAVRIHKSAKQLGITTYALVPLSDRESLHAKTLDIPLPMSGHTLASTYLNIDGIIELALANKIDMIHPGVGFLAENANFARACENAGIIFVGPSVDTLEVMGDKDCAKSKMISMGVPTLMGYQGEDQSIEGLRAQASTIGYPLLIKAVRGGGGKGMRLVSEALHFEAACLQAQEESLNAFGDSRVLLEKYCHPARHIEVQILGDGQRCIHLMTRDCSLQRRHQKLIEEGPAPFLDEELIEKIHLTALKVAESVQYRGAGTVEFLVDAHNNHFFMEMNTRLQVEHPVTEMICDIDLVEWQFKIAQGMPLTLGQSDIHLSGHAIEARIICEDPSLGFLPVTGIVKTIHTPSMPHLRYELGVLEREHIGLYYDPMIAKIIAWGQTREEARTRLIAALDASQFGGITTTIAYSRKLLLDTNFSRGLLSIDFIDKHKATLTLPSQADLRVWVMAALLFGSHSDSTLNHPYTLRLSCFNESKILHCKRADTHCFRVVVDKETHDVVISSLTLTQIKLFINGAEAVATFIQNKGFLTITLENERYDLEWIDSRVAHNQTSQPKDSGSICAPMPGLVKSLFKRVNDSVTKDTPLAVLVAMKMEHTICAPFDGKVVELNCQEGDIVEAGALLFELSR